jgi:hypothetical protein
VTRNRLIRPGAVLAAAALGAGLSMTVATTALAHAEVEVEPARALATDVLVTVFPEAHNHHAGATSVEVFLPEGISPQDVTLLDGPEGWEMTTGPESYTIAGDELEIDVSPLHRIQIRQLPDVAEIWFRILTTYSDGQVDRWIEIPTDDNPNPSNAAAGVTLAAADVAAAPSPTAEVAPPTAPSPTAEPAEDSAAAGDGGGNTGLLVGIIVLAVLAVAGAGWAIARRRGGTGSAS